MKRILQSRYFVLFLAIITGLIAGSNTRFLSEVAVYSLAIVMVAATSSFSFSAWNPPRKAIVPLLLSLLLNYVLYGAMMLFFAWLFLPDTTYWVGFVLIAAAPPGPSIIPFSVLLKGDVDFSVTGVFGGHLAAFFLSPLILWLFMGNSALSLELLFAVLIKVIIAPLFISRFLRVKRIYPYVEKFRGHVVKWGLFLVIVPTVGMSADLLFSQPYIVGITSLIFVMSMFGGGFIYGRIAGRLGFRPSLQVSSTLMLVIKSSAFSAVMALMFFDEKAALPSGILSIFVTSYIIVYAFFQKGQKADENIMK